MEPDNLSAHLAALTQTPTFRLVRQFETTSFVGWLPIALEEAGASPHMIRFVLDQTDYAYREAATHCVLANKGRRLVGCWGFSTQPVYDGRGVDINSRVTYVEARHRREGIATKMWEYVTKNTPALINVHAVTRAGGAFVRNLPKHLPELELEGIY